MYKCDRCLKLIPKFEDVFTFFKPNDTFNSISLNKRYCLECAEDLINIYTKELKIRKKDKNNITKGDS